VPRQFTDGRGGKAWPRRIAAAGAIFLLSLLLISAGKGRMGDYRIFLLNDDGHIAKSSRYFKCATDQEAVDKAQQIENGLDFEIWEGNRIIVRAQPPIGRKGR
jgi:hypothetical protein